MHQHRIRFFRNDLKPSLLPSIENSLGESPFQRLNPPFHIDLKSDLLNMLEVTPGSQLRAASVLGALCFGKIGSIAFSNSFVWVVFSVHMVSLLLCLTVVVSAASFIFR